MNADIRRLKDQDQKHYFSQRRRELREDKNIFSADYADGSDKKQNQCSHGIGALAPQDHRDKRNIFKATVEAKLWWLDL